VTGAFRSIAGSGAEWAAVLRQVDRSGQLTQRQANALLDTLALQLDAERALAARVLQRRLEARKRSER
jgi:hypothetical protein